MAKQIKLDAIPYFEPWWKQVGWIHDPNMDCFFSVAPDGEQERVSSFALFDMQRCGVYKAPKWFEEIYPDWRNQIFI